MLISLCSSEKEVFFSFDFAHWVAVARIWGLFQCFSIKPSVAGIYKNYVTEVILIYIRLNDYATLAVNKAINLYFSGPKY